MTEVAGDARYVSRHIYVPLWDNEQRATNNK